MGEWQPIETAPKDVPLLVFSCEARHPGVMVAELNTWEDSADWTDTWAEQGLDVEPTHWMPLPSPPALKADPERGD